MARSKPIMIACPQYRIAVRGNYRCEADGSCPMGPDANYILDRVSCSQHAGRCMQTLCALHRYNNRGPGSWYPEIIFALPDKSSGHSRRQSIRGSGPTPPGSTFSIEV